MKYLLLVVMLVTTLINEGSCLCGPQQLSVRQEQTGQIYNFAYTEYKVTVTNQCNCDQRQITFKCPNFRSFTKEDPSTFAKENDVCIVKSGSPLAAKASISFTYAWTQQWPLTPLSSQSSC